MSRSFDYIVLHPDCPEGEPWHLGQDLEPGYKHNLVEFARGLPKRPDWMVAVCATCHRGRPPHGDRKLCPKSWWRNPKYQGEIPPLRNSATKLICSMLTRTAEIREQMKAKAETSPWGFRTFVRESLFPPWAGGAEAGVRDRLAMIALDHVYWDEVLAELGVVGPYYTNAGPGSGNLMHCDVPKVIAALRDKRGDLMIPVLEQIESVGDAQCVGSNGAGVAEWTLRVYGADQPGRWVVLDRWFRPAR